MTDLHASGLLELCRRHLDPGSQPVTVHAGNANTTLLRVATPSHGEVIIKAHRSRNRYANELHAYRHWTSAIAAYAPRLLTQIDDPPALIITALPGSVLAELDLPIDRERAAYEQAGALLAAWHAAQPPTASVDMTSWLADRGHAWLELATDVLPARDRNTIRAHLRELSAITDVPAVPCHLDLTPRNLIRDRDGTVRLIDFEHARMDLAARDLVRLADRYWRGRPDLEAAFLNTYGPLTDLDREIIEHCTYVDRLTTAVRAAGRQLPPGPDHPPHEEQP